MVHDQRRGFFDHHAPGWDNGDHKKKQERLRKIFSDFLPTIQTPVLDLGSGTGILIPMLLDREVRNQKIIELDLSFRMLVQAASKMKENGKITYLNGDVHYLPFPDQCIATVICFEAFPHFRNQPHALQELHRVLVTGGNLIILHLMGHERLNAYHDHVGDAILHDHLPPLSELVRMLRQNNFHILRSLENEDLYLIEVRKLYSFFTFLDYK